MAVRFAELRRIAGLPAGFWVIGSVVAAAVACAGSDGKGDFPKDDPTAADPSSPTTSPRTDFCGASADVATRCPGARPSACDRQIGQSCAGLAGVANASLLDQAGACVAKSACGAATTSCLSSSLVKAQPTPAQKALAASFCARCTDAAPKDTCESAFFNPIGDASALAQLLLPVGDGITQEIAASCVSPSCKDGFATCAEAVVTRRLGEALSTDAARCFLEALTGNAAGGAPPPPPPDLDAGPPPPPPDGGTAGASFDLYVVEAEVPKAKADGSDWDPFGGAPDPYVEVSLGSATSGKSNTQQDTIAPSFNQKIASNLPADLLHAATVKMLDSDLIADDWIGDCAGPLVPASGVQTFLCPGSSSLYGPGFTLRYQLAPH